MTDHPAEENPEGRAVTQSYPEPSWVVFGPCPRCGAADGAPCLDMRGVPSGWVPRTDGPAARSMRNPHPKRRKVRN